MHYANQLEPEQLINYFLQHPPEGFEAARAKDGMPFFVSDYNLLTTLDRTVQKKIIAVPFYKTWKKWITPRTCFIGTTVSEYVLMPPDSKPAELIENCKAMLAPHYPFLIIKDLPKNSPLLTDSENIMAAECTAAAKFEGFIMIEGQALAYVPINFSTTDEYLSRLSKVKRKSLRRKLKSRDVLEIDYLSTGHLLFNDEAAIYQFYQLYLNVYQQSEIHFDKLTRGFFAEMLRDPASGGVVITYRRQGELIGYNICFAQGDKFLDKYVGFQYPAARDHNLYFVSWFMNLQYALDHNLKFYVAGWTDPEVKKFLGASFTFTCHAVYIRNPIVRTLLKPFAFFFERDARALAAT